MSFDKFFYEDNERYKLFFGIENACGIFRSKSDQLIEDKSENYDLVYYSPCSSVSVDDALKDLFFMYRSSLLQLNTDDVVCVKINGISICYRFIGYINNITEECEQNFVECSSFLQEERSKYLLYLEHTKKMLSILDANIYSLEELDPRYHLVCCIDKESFKKTIYTSNIISEYTLYILKNISLKRIEPCKKPFNKINNLQYYLKKLQSGNKSLVLLNNRAELEHVRDYWQLQGMVS